MGVILIMLYDIAHTFKDAHAELQDRLGNPFIAFDTNGEMLPLGFVGLSKDEAFSNYTNRTITTNHEVSYLQKDYYIAHSGEPQNRMRIWKIEGRIIQGQKIGTKIYTTSLEPQAQLVMTSNGLFAV